MKRLVLGVLAHVDAGKTTLSEAMLYRAGEIRRLGRVDHGDTCLDTDDQERARGITIFSAAARLRLRQAEITLLDTPGHVDFSAETERALQVLDVAVLVVSASEGVQSHTLTLWRLLQRYRLPTFVFLNKMDLPGADAQRTLAALRRQLGEGFVQFWPPRAGADGPAASAGTGATGATGAQNGGAAAPNAAALGTAAPRKNDRSGVATAAPGTAAPKNAAQGAVAQGAAAQDGEQLRLDEALLEELALCDEALMDLYLAGAPAARLEAALTAAVGARRIFPCLCGCALKGEGIDPLFEALERFAPAPAYGPDFAAQVYKITYDGQGARHTYLKITGGSLALRDPVRGQGPDGPWQEKVTGLRLADGARWHAVEEAPAGSVCVVTGLTHTHAGQGLGAQPDAPAPTLQPVLTYRLRPGPGDDPHAVLDSLRRLEQQDPQLHVSQDAATGAIRLQLMGEVQLEVLRQQLREQGMAPDFDEGAILYRETVAEPVEGVGHYEPLRHYAEVHLLLEPGERGSGLQFASACRTDDLDKNWQRLVLTHLAEKTHLGVLTGAPVTDLKVTLLAGRAHPKHTEGGDFREATYRALRQGLRSTRCLLLQPWYSLELEVPAEHLGRVLTELTRRGAETQPPRQQGDTATLTGAAPVAALRDFPAWLRGAARGRARLSLLPAGYRPCDAAETAALVAASGYRPDADLANPADSIFCAHGAGFLVKWDQVRRYMHIDTGWGRRAPAPLATAAAPRPAPAAAARYRGTLEQDKELLAIFERTYGPIRRRADPAAAFRPTKETLRQEAAPLDGEYLLVDGYNILFAWDDLHALAQEDLNAARQRLMDILCNYRGWHGGELILVFDAYRVKGGAGSVEEYHGIHVVYTKEAETADMYIERTTHQLGGRYRVRVATSDGLEQMIILGHGALRLSADGLRQEVEAAEAAIRACLEENSKSH